MEIDQTLRNILGTEMSKPLSTRSRRGKGYNPPKRKKGESDRDFYLRVDEYDIWFEKK